MKSVLLACCLALAARAETKQERGRKLVDECITALGGPRYLNMQDRVESGRAYSFYREQLNGLSLAKIYTRYQAVKDTATGLGLREHQSFGKKEESGVLFTETGAWEITFRGARPLPNERYQRYRDTTLHNIFYILRVRLKEPGMIFESRGADVLNNRPVEIVDINDARNETTTVYFDQTTKLPVRQVFYRRDPVTRDRDEEVTEFSKYRDIGGGVLWPFAIRRDRNGERIFEIYAESVDIDKHPNETLFNLPNNIKLLKPE
jgi:hypothetical protein